MSHCYSHDNPFSFPELRSFWRRWRENNRNEEERRRDNNRILWPENLYKWATFYLFLRLYSSPEELTWIGSVLSAKNPFVEKIICKGTWLLNAAILVSLHFRQFQCLHRNVSGCASSILLPPWLPEWPCPEKRPGFYLYFNKLQKLFTFPWRGSFGVIHNDSLRIQKC